MSAAIGVAIVSVNCRREFAPVLKGEACANAAAGVRRRTAVGGQRADRTLGAVIRPTARPLVLSEHGMLSFAAKGGNPELPPGREFKPGLPGSARSKARTMAQPEPWNSLRLKAPGSNPSSDRPL